MRSIGGREWWLASALRGALVLAVFKNFRSIKLFTVKLGAQDDDALESGSFEQFHPFPHIVAQFITLPVRMKDHGRQATAVGYPLHCRDHVLAVEYGLETLLPRPRLGDENTIPRSESQHQVGGTGIRKPRQSIRNSTGLTTCQQQPAKREAAEDSSPIQRQFCDQPSNTKCH